MSRPRDIKLEKVTVNIGVGEAGDKLAKAVKLLKNITGGTPIQTSSIKRIPTWGVRPNLAIACKVTLRRKKAEDMLKRFFAAIDNKINTRKFDKFGNFSFGIAEYINIPGAEYDPDIGIIGMDVAVTLERAGFSIKRKRKESKIGLKHRITKEEAIVFIKEKFGVEVVGDDD